VIGPTKTAGACRAGSVETGPGLADIADKYICSHNLAVFQTAPIETRCRTMKSSLSAFTGTTD
jgi:hypothetical protein